MVTINSNDVKKWAVGTGTVSAVAIITYLLYLQFIGAIAITGYSGDMICAGTPSDPCYAFINFTANQNVNMTMDESMFETSPAISSWTLHRSWGTGWRQIDISQPIILNKGTSYQWRITAMKKRADDVIKWSAFNGKIDPTWEAAKITPSVSKTAIDTTFPKLIFNDAGKTDSSFQINNPLGRDIDITNLKINFNQVCGKVTDYQIKIVETKTLTREIPNYKDVETCKDVMVLNNKTLAEEKIKECTSTRIIDSIKTESYEETSYNPTTTIKSGLNSYYLDADTTFENCGKDKYGYQIDWIPELTLDTTSYTKSDWAWWNTTMSNKIPINCSKVTAGTPIVVNGSNGFYLNGQKQIVWTNCQDTALALYYNSNTSYVIANDTAKVPFEVELGGMTSYNPTDVWDANFTSVYHLSNTAGSQKNGIGLTANTGATLATTPCAIGNCYAFSGTNTGHMYASAKSNLTAGSVTMEVWGKASSAANYDTLACYKDDTNPTLCMIIYPTSLKWSILDGGGSDETGTTADTNAHYHQIQYNAGNFLYYLDNTILTNSSKTNPVPSQALWLGTPAAPANWASWNWAGTLDEVRISNIPRGVKYRADVWNNFNTTPGYGILGTAEAPQYQYKMAINCSNMASGTPIVINGSKGFNLGFGQQIVWTKCQASDLYLYFNLAGDYYLKNLTSSTVPYEVEVGNGVSVNPTQVWTDYFSVYHMIWQNASALKDSSPYAVHANSVGSTAATNSTDCLVGVCILGANGGNPNSAYTSYFGDTAKSPITSNAAFTEMGWFKATANDNYMTAMDVGLGNHRSWTTHASFGTNLIFNLGGADLETSLPRGTGLARITFTGFETTYARGYSNSSTTGVTQYLGSSFANPNANNITMCIGCTGNTKSWNFIGTMDEYRIYNGNMTTTMMGTIVGNYQTVAGYGTLGAQENTELAADVSVNSISILPQPTSGADTLSCAFKLIGIAPNANTTFSVNWLWLNASAANVANGTMTAANNTLVNIPTNITASQTSYGETWTCSITAQGTTGTLPITASNTTFINLTYKLIQGKVLLSDGTTSAGSGVTVDIFNDTDAALFTRLTTNSSGYFNYTISGKDSETKIVYVVAQDRNNRSRGSDAKSFFNISFS